MTSVVRFISVLVTAVFLMVADSYLVAVDETIPLGSNVTISASFNQSSLSKEEIIKNLTSISDGSQISLAKLVPNPQDFLKDRSLYYFTEEQIEEGAILWYRPDYRGESHRANLLGDASLDGVYLARISSPQDLIQLLEGLDRLGASYDYSRVSSLSLLGYTIFSQGYWVGLISICLLLLIASLTYSAYRVKVQLLQTLTGQPYRRVFWTQLARFYRLIFPPALATYLLSLLLVFFLRGAEHLRTYALTALPFLVVLLLLSLLAVLLAGIMTSLRLDDFAQRKLGIQNFRFMAESSKYLAVLLTALTLPLIATQGMQQLGLAQSSSYWQTFNGLKSLRIKASPEQLDRAESALMSLSRQAEDEQGFYLSYAIDPGQMIADNFGEYDGIILATDSYLQKVTSLYQTSYREVDEQQLEPNLRSHLRSQIGIFLTDPNNFSALHYLTPQGSGPFPAISMQGDRELKLYSRPLILSVGSLSTTYKESFNTSLMTSGNILYKEDFPLAEKSQELGLASLVLSIDRASDSGLQSSQQAEARARSLSLALILNLSSLILSTLLATHIYLLGRVRTHYPQRTAGRSWLQILSRRLILETSLCLGIGLTVWGFCALLGWSYSWTAVLVGLLLVAASLPSHLFLAPRIFDRANQRSLAV